MIKTDYFLLIVLCLTVGTVAIRGCFIALSSRLVIGPQLRQLFTFIPAAIFPAIVVPATFFHSGHVGFVFGKERFIVLLLATVLAYFVRNTLFVVLTGLGLLYFISQF